MDDVRNLEELLKETLGSTYEIKEKFLTCLTAPGDNYGSLMLKLDLILRNKKNKNEEKLPLVAKKIPRSVIFQKVFDIQVTFKKEVAMYKTIVPTLEQFINRNTNRTLNFFPKFYASRFNLQQTDDVIDEDGVLILENLKVAGYTNIDRRSGFDFDTTKLILRDLAEFHATPLALKLKNPALFKEKIEIFCKDNSFSSDRYKEIREYSDKLISEHPQCALIKEKINFINSNNKQQPNDTYGTLIHFDLWINNIMLKFGDNNKAIATKFVDFQVFQCGSPGSDLFFFLFTSVKEEVLIENLDNLIKYYHEEFVKCLTSLTCDTTPYTLESLYDEIKIFSKFEFGHAFFFNVFIINADKDEENSEGGGGPEHMLKSVSQRSKEKGWFMTLECEKRGWLPKLE